MPKANRGGSIVGTRRGGRFCASCRIWRGICGRNSPRPNWSDGRMRKATRRRREACRQPSGSCLRGYNGDGAHERPPNGTSGVAPDPTGAAPLRPALEELPNLSQRRKNKEAWRRSFAPAFRLILRLENATSRRLQLAISPATFLAPRTFPAAESRWPDLRYPLWSPVPEAALHAAAAAKARG
jgi:hypothetical protein